MQFHENLKRIANQQGTSPTALLKELGLSTSKVSAWNTGSLPKQEVLVKLAERLNCSVMDFFWSEEDEARLLHAKPEQPENDDEKDILEIYRALPRREKHEFMTMIYDFQKHQELAGDEAVKKENA